MWRLTIISHSGISFTTATAPTVLKSVSKWISFPHIGTLIHSERAVSLSESDKPPVVVNNVLKFRFSVPFETVYRVGGFNPNDYPVTLHAFGKYEVYIEDGKAGTEVLRTVEDDYTVKAISAIVLARKRQEPEEES